MDKNEYIVMVQLEDGRYAQLEVKNRSSWRTKAIAQHHGYEYKAKYLRDAWIENTWVHNGKCYGVRRNRKV